LAWSGQPDDQQDDADQNKQGSPSPDNENLVLLSPFAVALYDTARGFFIIHVVFLFLQKVLRVEVFPPDAGTPTFYLMLQVLGNIQNCA
jgi:hypothetical protein